VKGKGAKTVLKHLVLALTTAFVLIPFAWMLYTSALTDREASAGLFKGGEKTRREGALIVRRLRIVGTNYRTALTRSNFPRQLFNTVLATAVITVSVVVTSVLAGFAFGMTEFRGKRLLFFCFIATLMIPFEVTLLPNYLVVSRIKEFVGCVPGLGGASEYLALVLPWLASAFGVFLMRQHFSALERDYYDAARLDGCSDWRFIRSVAAPMLKPAVLTVALFVFVGSWNAFMWPLVITDDASYRLLQNGLYAYIAAEKMNYNLLMAAAAVNMLPTVLVFLAAQRFFVEGVGAGGVKM